MRVMLAVAVSVAMLSGLGAAPADLAKRLPEDTLAKLSLDGEKLLAEEVNRALYGVKQMEEVMRTNGRKHEHLMKSLRHSSDKTQGAAQLAKEVTERLEKAEEQCQASLQSEWEQCRPCLEDACKTFYTSSCRRGFATFQAKVEDFFRRVSRRFSPREPPMEPGDITVNESPGDPRDLEVASIEHSFHRLLSKMDNMVDRSSVLVSRMNGKLDVFLRKAFLNRTHVEETTSGPYYPARDSGFLQGVGLDEVLDSFFDFGRRVEEEFGAWTTLTSHWKKRRKIVAPKHTDGDNIPVRDTQVEVTILNLPPFILSVPGELELQDPVFIQYVTQETLGNYKEIVRREDE